MKHGIWLINGGSGWRDVERAVAAEAAGWDGVFVSDTLGSDPERYTDPWTLLAAIASRTERIRLGTWVTPIPAQEPWRLARTVACLDRLSRGRVILGTGMGTEDQYASFGEPYDPPALGRRYDEALEIITGLWRGGPYDFDGEFFHVEGAALPVTPRQSPRVPILTAGWWPNRAPFRRAARWDGVMPYWPALLSGQPGPDGQRSSATVEGELRDLLTYYRDLREEPGEILLPRPNDDPAYDALCEELGATWMLTTSLMEIDDIAQGPPSAP